MTVTLHHADCREAMRAMPDASVDAIVCDPPYHLTTGKKGGSGPASVNLNTPQGRARVTTGFMGMTWDGGEVAHDPAVWAECLRVAKPGAYLVAFGGTRTFHRLACAIEDAGWELRESFLRGHMPQPEDCPWLLGWLFASGFPKSHNLDNLRGKDICGCERSESSSEHDLRDLRDTDVSASVDAAQGCGEVLQPRLSQQGASAQGRTQPPAAEVWSQQPSLEGRGDDLQEEGELLERALCASARMGAADGSQGRLRDGAPPDDGRVVRLHADPDRGCAPPGSQPGAQREGESGTVAGQQEPQARGAWPVCRGCGKPILPKGLGTAAKPAWEPIVVARKPLVGTVAENVIQHGTGALNIDACRIGWPNGTPPEVGTPAWGGPAKKSTAVPGQDGETVDREPPNALGRWPANLIHDGSPEVVALFPSEAGAAAPVRTRNGDKFRNAYGAFAGNIDEQGSTFHGDSGSAARFFYCAKATQEDRNEGLYGFTAQQQDPARKAGNPGGDNPRNRGVHERANHHPTVKPTDLMRWLCRLVTPKGGVILDPFMGSGSTGKAAVLEGFSFIGIDLTPEYVEIARARIAFAQRMGHQPSLLTEAA